jgi:hypothetical protein
MMIKLSDDCYVAADQIAVVKTDDYRNYISVITKDGSGHIYNKGHGEGVYAAMDRLISQINSATSSPQ